jgi:hypothetical protein
MTDRKRRFLAGALSLYVAFVFIQSLFFKFTDSPETQYIFGTLDAWGASLGFAGLFARNGIFSQYVVGSAELVASLLLLAGLLTGRVLLHGAGALLALGVISGAIFFHLFTPLGVDPYDDGAQLFKEACFTWVMAAFVLFAHRAEAFALLRRYAPFLGLKAA